MHDEACPSWEDMLDNMRLGHDFILKEFGVKPRIGWQVDPFGHSNTNARLFAEMGFDALFFARMDGADKDQRKERKALEWLWMPYGESSDVNILTHAFINLYFNPDGFCFDTTCDDMFVTDPDSDAYNAEEQAQKMLESLD